MKNFIKNLVAFIGVCALGMGVVNASPSLDCGDDDAKPINTQTSVKSKAI